MRSVIKRALTVPRDALNAEFKKLSEKITSGDVFVAGAVILFAVNLIPLIKEKVQKTKAVASSSVEERKDS